jgi:uncharacterized membrane protein
MPWVNTNQPTTMERVIGGICYLTCGIAGILYIVLSGKSEQSSFFRFHFLQSIILCIVAFLLSWCSGAFSFVTGGFLGVVSSIDPVSGVYAGKILTGLMKAIGIAFALLPIYGMIWCFLGKYAEIPFISRVVYQQLR